MTSRNYFERICERMTTHEERNLGQRSVFFFTSEWPYEEVNKVLEECDIKYKWSNDRSFLELMWEDIGYKKIQNKIELNEAQKDFQ